MSEQNVKVNAFAEPVGVVVIGRNEGKRLERCLLSLTGQTAGPLVYVDSGSTDGSVEMARGLGVHVEELDMSIPFTMARGRNAGFKRLMETDPDLNWVQFVDGDCEVDKAWVDHALSFLQCRPEVVAVCGFRRERYPHASIYNHLIDLEWQGPVGEISACGGDAMYRTEAFKKLGGFNTQMIAGEEPELCVRLRKAGGLIWRIDRPMTVHEAALTNFRQWWRRANRGGHAYAEGFALHGAAPYFHNRKQVLSLLFYGLLVPTLWGVGVLLGLVFESLSFLIPLTTLMALGIYLKPFIGAFLARRDQAGSVSDTATYAGFCVLAKFPEAHGALHYFANRLFGKRSRLIEYKNLAS